MKSVKRKSIINSIIIITVFLIAFYGKKLLTNHINIPFPSPLPAEVHFYLWWSIPSFLALGILYGFKEIFKAIGINKGFLIGLIFSLITVLPMFLSSAIIGEIEENLKISPLIHKTIIAGFMEEYLFRGFLFGILFRKLKWGFIPASILGALIFGLGHVYQGSTFIETAGIFFITAIGAIWFSWLYIEWNENLWIPIFLHGFMNFSWILFDVSSNALGGLYVNIFRVITIALTIIITIVYHKKNGLRINRKNLITN